MTFLSHFPSLVYYTSFPVTIPVPPEPEIARSRDFKSGMALAYYTDAGEYHDGNPYSGSDEVQGNR
jgi:hypothetical protein